MNSEVETTPVRARETPRDVTACPSCGVSGLEPFYEVADIPAHCVMLMHTREQAITYPRGGLRLAFCRSCAAITNTRFDVTLNDYSPDFEETQHFSPTFGDWARQLAERLVRDYQIRGKRLIEIGCGKGEFLQLMCRAGDNQGIGIDPGCIPGRLEGEGADRVRFIRDLYSEQYADLPGDVVLCRHTLEHIHQTREFMRMVRRVIGSRRDTLVFLEVPDTTRVLRERAFWDIYYEHCTYLTAGSLGRLFRSTGFEIVELVRDFADQYLWVTARPAGGDAGRPLPVEDDLETTAREVESFRQMCPRDITAWRDRLRGLAAAGQRPVVWGAGSKAVALLTTCGVQDEVAFLVDINPHKAGKFLPGTGHEVVAPERLSGYQPRTVVAMNPIYLEEIRQRLAALNVSADVIAL